MFSSTLCAQTAGQTELLRLTDELRSAITQQKLTLAANLAAKLDDAVKAQQHAWLIRDADQRVEEVLTWLPVDTESLWVNQNPFVVKADESLSLLNGRATELYSVDRLSALSNGRFYRLLSGRTIRLVVAGTRNIIHSQELSVPAVLPKRDVAYFYFLSEPIDLGSQDEYIQKRPVWRAPANIDDIRVPFRPGVERPQLEDENWLALARPDLLVVTNSKELLGETLERIEHGSQTRAYPPSLTEWKHVDRRASFWGLRHYTDQAKPKPNERGYVNAALPEPDGAAAGVAAGVAVNFDAAGQRLEIRYLSQAPLTAADPAEMVHGQFLIDQAEPGVWRLVSDIKAKGDFPVHFALAMLGFGGYR